MSRADWISAGVTLIVASVGWFISGKEAAIIFLAIGVLIVVAVHLTRARKKMTEKDEHPAIKDSFNPRVTQTANPVINVYAGQAAPAAEPVPAPRREMTHNVVFLGARTVGLQDDGYEGLSFHESTAKTHLTGIVACFRNQPIYGRTIGTVYNARVHLRLIDSGGAEIGTGLSRACWLGQKGDMVDLSPGGESGCTLVLLANNGSFMVPWKRREREWMGDVVVDRNLELAHLPHAIEISLLDSDNQLVIEPILLHVTLTDGRLKASAVPTS